MNKIIKKNLGLIKTPDTKLIIFCGSRLNQKSKLLKYADYDFFIITSKTDKVKIWALKKSVRIECFYYSKERLKNCILNDDPIIIRAIATGKILYNVDPLYTKKLLRRIKSRFSNFKISPLNKSKLLYRMDMIEQKIKCIKKIDYITNKWLVSYALPYIIKSLFFINNKTTPSIQNWIKEVVKLKIKPSVTEHFLEEALKNEGAITSLRKNTFRMLRFIKSRLSQNFNYTLEFIPSKFEQTTII